MNRKTLENTAPFILCATVVVFFSTEFILNLTPPISRDALIHHLAVPNLWLKYGGYYEIPWAEYSYYPMYINLFYLVCLYLKNDIAPKFIHLSFGIATSWLIYLYLKQKFDRNWGLLGMVIFITTPIVVWLSTSAYIDLGMTFFTTGSVLAFIKWRDVDNSRFKWFLISSLCMGIAIGSKYNALIVWFIVNLMLMFSYVRDTNRQKSALKYGIMFSVITILVASPWYFKNYLQTGNPFYPLFNSFFKLLHHQTVQEALNGQAIEKTGKISFFKIRQVMYGESFWETMLIPIRMFFQGKDSSYQYFQGSLNPILIIFLPFALLNKRYGKDKIFFVCFTVIFIFMAFFLTAKQVRYILPVLPFLSILAVMGIKDVMDKLKEETFLSSLKLGKNTKSIARILLFAVVAISLIFNLVYLKSRVNIIKPFPYVMGNETREAFLKRHLLHYDAVEYINNNLPVDAKIFTMFLGRRGYYIDRAYQNESSFGMSAISHMVNSSDDEDKFLEYIRSMNVTHILMRSDLVKKYLQDNFSTKEVNRLLKLIRKYWKKDYENKGYIIWDIQNRLIE
ncbi:MAG: phospholipid carrier-dependent glycosyltransferase [Deltaproteobacteria bacterium]|nr:phospholipid carrier-dependent glycosyltransferase [Deltaproteobacteria bacterium]